MTTILDILGSMLIASVVFMIMLNMNLTSNTAKFSSDQNLILQQNAKTLADIINHDMRKISYRVDSTAFLLAQEKKMIFYSDIDSNGTIDKVTYALSDSLVVPNTINPRDKVLYRIVGTDTSKGSSLGLVNAKFSYKNILGQTTTKLDSIKYIRAEIWVETTEPVDGKYPFTYWEMTINPRNL